MSTASPELAENTHIDRSKASGSMAFTAIEVIINDTVKSNLCVMYEEPANPTSVDSDKVETGSELHIFASKNPFDPVAAHGSKVKAHTRDG